MLRAVEEVLILETDPMEAEAHADLLRAAGYSTVLAVDSADALRHLDRSPRCRLVLAEMRLPGRSGFCLLESVLAQHPHVSVVLSTSDRDPQLVLQGFRRGAIDVLLKPCSRRALLFSVESALLQGRMRSETLQYLRGLESTMEERTAKLRSIMYDLERSYDVTIEAMGDALDMRDEETEGHSKRVTAYTIALARQMRLTPAELKVIARGAFLHDIGKIAIPDSILLKPGPLTAEEMVVMRSHCEQGYRIVHKIPFLEAASEIVLTHQECFDGSGYPQGLRGEQIPIGARIFAIADTLDAITSDRPYRAGRSFAEAIKEITRGAGTQFDPEVVEVFLSMPRSTWPDIRKDIGRDAHASDIVRRAAA